MLISVICVAGWIRGSQVPVALYLLLPGVLLGAVNRAMAIRRAAHGLALDAEGVTFPEIFTSSPSELRAHC